MSPSMFLLEETTCDKGWFRDRVPQVRRTSLWGTFLPDAGMWSTCDHCGLAGSRIVLGCFHVSNLLSLRASLSSPGLQIHNGLPYSVKDKTNDPGSNQPPCLISLFPHCLHFLIIHPQRFDSLFSLLISH